MKRVRQALSACNNSYNCTTACVVNDSGGMPGQVLVFRESKRKQGERGGTRAELLRYKKKSVEGGQRKWMKRRLEEEKPILDKRFRDWFRVFAAGDPLVQEAMGSH